MIERHYSHNSILLMLLLAVAASTAPSAAADPFQNAAWLRDPVFTGTKPLEVFALHHAKVKGTDLQNVHTYFRKEFDLPAKPTNALLYVTADDYYKLFANGRFVVQGPEPGYPFAHPYYEIEITHLLKKGRNCLAAHAYYHGLVSRAFNSADNRSGFTLRLNLTYPDGSVETIATDETWKCYHETAFPSDRVFGYQTQFNENIDMRLVPVGWRGVGFDDSQWKTPVAERQESPVRSADDASVGTPAGRSRRGEEEGRRTILLRFRRRTRRAHANSHPRRKGGRDHRLARRRAGRRGHRSPQDALQL